MPPGAAPPASSRLALSFIGWDLGLTNHFIPVARDVIEKEMVNINQHTIAL